MSHSWDTETKEATFATAQLAQADLKIHDDVLEETLKALMGLLWSPDLNHWKPVMLCMQLSRKDLQGRATDLSIKDKQV